MLLASTAVLAGTACPEHFVAGKAPVVTNAKMQARTRELCFEAFAVLHSGLTRTPLYAAEHLTRENLKQARLLPRKDSFHVEKRLPENDRAELDDYARSGYDRGHMAPNADFANEKAQGESFSLANMVPQVHANNAGVWAGLEGAARKLATSEGELYVVSGPFFGGGKTKSVGKVMVPNYIWKVFYSPKQRRAGAYWVANEDTQENKTFTVSELEKKIGMSVLPGVPQSVRDAGMTMPEPAAPPGRKPKAEPGDEPPKQPAGKSEDDAAVNRLIRFISQLLQLISQLLK